MYGTPEQLRLIRSYIFMHRMSSNGQVIRYMRSIGLAYRMTEIISDINAIRRALEEQEPEGTLYEIIVQGNAVASGGRRSATDVYFAGYVRSLLDADELAMEVLHQIEDMIGGHLFQTEAMYNAGMNRVDVKVAVRQEQTQGEETEDFINGAVNNIEAGLGESKFFGKSHHGPKGKFKTGVSKQYEKEYEEGE